MPQDTPTDYLHRGHRITIVPTPLRNGRWNWIAEIDGSVIVPMGDTEGARSRHEAIEAALARARAVIDGMPA